jgi:hypothetical protein
LLDRCGLGAPSDAPVAPIGDAAAGAPS